MQLSLRVVLAVVAAGGAAAPLACTVIVPANQVQCSTDADCQARGPSFAHAVCSANVCVAPEGGSADPWACLTATPEPSDPSAQIGVHILLYNALSAYTFAGSIDGGADLNLVSYVPEVGANVTACNSLDTSCAMPAAGPVDVDDAGRAALTISGGFTGFYQILENGYVPAYFYPGARLLADQPQITFPTSIQSEAQISMLQQYLGLSANTDTDAGPGLLSITQFDCNDHHAAGVQFTTTPGPEVTLYAVAKLPVESATQTSDEGAAVLVNVPAGTVGITSMLAPGPGQDAGRALSSFEVVVRHGSITLVELRPRAR